jgi:hypothetical protein
LSRSLNSTDSRADLQDDRFDPQAKIIDNSLQNQLCRLWLVIHDDCCCFLAQKTALGARYIFPPSHIKAFRLAFPDRYSTFLN